MSFQRGEEAVSKKDSPGPSTRRGLMAPAAGRPNALVVDERQVG